MTTSLTILNNKAEGVGLTNIQNVSTAINIYLVKQLWLNPQGFSYIGSAIEIPSKNMIFDEDYLDTSGLPVVTHEMGHCLNLEHTFKGTLLGTGGCAESIVSSRPNCDDCGDYVCDTPADGNVRDTQGYMPDLFNFMSYYSGFNRFTTGQRRRMLDAIEALPILQDVISSTCVPPNLTTIAFLCHSNPQILLVENIDNNTATWRSSFNVSINSFSSSSVTISPITSLSAGMGWIEAALSNGFVIRREFWIGKPDATDMYLMTSGSGYNISTQVWYQLTAHHINFNILKHSKLVYEWDIMYSQTRSDPPRNKAIMVYPMLEGTFPYKVRSENDCGCSDWASFMFQVTASPSPGDFIISPIGGN
jgi:hypothetical protein